jgi:hypothetical protein
MATTTVENQSVVEQYQTAQAEYEVLANRIRELDTANLTRILTADEAIEASSIDRRIAAMGPQLEALRKEAAYEDAAGMVEAYAEGANRDVPAIHAAFDDLMEHLAATKAAFDRLCALVQRGEQRTAHLPITMQERLNYPSVPAVQTNLASRLGIDLRLLNEITPQRREAARDIVPNSRPVNRIALQRWLNEHKERLYREAGRGE